jgi:hypothetical protein
MGQLSEFFRRQVLIEITPRVETTDGKTKEGEVFKRRIQTGYMVSVDEYGEQERMRIRLPLREDDVPYQTGMAIVSGESFDRNNWGDLELKKYGVRFVPIPPGVWAMIEADAKRT